jgi:large subunit ribosomal protein L25
MLRFLGRQGIVLAMLNLAIETREAGKNLDELRKAKKVPAVFYGKKETATPVVLSLVDFMKVWNEAGESSVITLSGIGETKEALIHDVDLDPVKNIVRHVDLYVIEKGKKVEVSIPLEFIGTAPAEKLGASVLKVLHEIDIEAFPKDLPPELTVDVSILTELEQQILVGDIKVPAGVTVLTSLDEVVAIAAETKEEVVEETPADLSAIEISEERGKKEEEEGEAEAE